MENVTLKLVLKIAKRNLSHKKNLHDDTDKLVTELASLTHCRLDREKLESVPKLDILPCLTNLYLQCNEIKEICDLSALTGLRFLTLAENEISQIRGIKSLKKLGFLDLSENKIVKVDYSEIPENLVILNIADNPCSEVPMFVDEVTENLPNLKSLDGRTLDLKTDESSSDSESESDAEHEQSYQDELYAHNATTREKDGNFYEDMTAQINDSFQEFHSALMERDKELQNDFADFTSIAPSPIPPKSTEFSDETITALEREVAEMTVLKPIDKSKKIPHPPASSRSGNKSRRRPISENKNASKVRIPGARPFRRVCD